MASKRQTLTKVSASFIARFFPMNEYFPDYSCPPGDTILDILIGQFADELLVTQDYAEKLIRADIEIDEELAEKLASHLGSTPQFWLEREKQYRDALVKNN